MLKGPQVQCVVIRMGCAGASAQFRLQLMRYAAGVQITL
jgi:hypothetical protein